MGLGFGVVVVVDVVVVCYVLWLVLYFFLDFVDRFFLVFQVVFVVGESYRGEAVPFCLPFVGASGFNPCAFEYVEGRLCV